MSERDGKNKNQNKNRRAKVDPNAQTRIGGVNHREICCLGVKVPAAALHSIVLLACLLDCLIG